MLSPRIIFEDQHLIVLSKPAGLLSQGDVSGEENLVDWLRKYLGRNYVGLVHRLDRNTSGAMVVAKRSKAADRLTQSLQSGELERRYLAFVIGQTPSHVRWEHLLVKDEARNVVEVVSQPSPQAKKAALSADTRAQIRWENLELSVLEFKLETGRSHQIRVQAAFEGYPLLGDLKYSHGLPADKAKASARFGRPALHSHFISFPHPMSHERMSFELPLPDDMARLWKGLPS